MGFNNVEEVQHWPPKVVLGKHYDLSHLNAKRILYTLAAKAHQPKKDYSVIVTYSYHVFAKEIPLMSEEEKQLRMYIYHGERLRPIHDE